MMTTTTTTATTTATTPTTAAVAATNAAITTTTITRQGLLLLLLPSNFALDPYTSNAPNLNLSAPNPTNTLSPKTPNRSARSFAAFFRFCADFHVFPGLVSFEEANSRNPEP